MLELLGSVAFFCLWALMWEMMGHRAALRRTSSRAEHGAAMFFKWFKFFDAPPTRGGTYAPLLEFGRACEYLSQQTMTEVTPGDKRSHNSRLVLSPHARTEQSRPAGKTCDHPDTTTLEKTSGAILAGVSAKPSPPAPQGSRHMCEDAFAEWNFQLLLSQFQSSESPSVIQDIPAEGSES